MRGPRALGGVRVRRFADGSYAVSVRDRATQRSTLIEGDRRRARLVHVDGDAWAEAVTAPLVVPGGVARTTVRLAGDRDGTVRRDGMTEYPNGTRRADRLTLGGEAFERVSHWEFSDGTAAQATWQPDGVRELVELSPDGQPTRTLRSAPLGAGIAQFATPAEGAITRRVIEHGDGSFTSREVITGPDGATGSITTTVHSDRSAEQHIVTSELGGSSRTDFRIGSDGSTDGLATATIVRSEGVVSVTRESRFDARTGSHREDIGITDVSSGSTQGFRSGIDGATGEGFMTGTARDRDGNESASTVTTHRDGSFTITTVSRGADGDESITEEGFDADGRETGSARPAPPARERHDADRPRDRAEGERPSGGEEEGEAEGGEESGEEGDGSLPSGEGSGDGLGPTGGGSADDILGRHLGLGAGGDLGRVGVLLGGALGGGMSVRPEPGELEIVIEDIATAVRHRLSADAATGGATPGFAILDVTVPAPAVTTAEATDGWSDMESPAALVAVVERIAGPEAGAIARTLG